MTMISIGDLAQSFQLRRANTRLSETLNRLASEMSGGRVHDLVKATGGDLRSLASIEAGLARNRSYLTLITEKNMEASVAQTSLGELRQLAQEVSGILTIQPELSTSTLAETAGIDALGRFVSAIGVLNVETGGRTIFAGTASDGPALADPEAILTDLEAAIAAAGAASADDVAFVVGAWFEFGGGYDSSGYLGSAPAAQGLRLSDTEVAPPFLTASEPAIREMLGGLALGALLGRGALATNSFEQSRLARLAGVALISADSAIVALQARVGTVESQLARAETEAKAETEGLEMAKARLIGADPYSIAVDLEETQLRLETLYSLTARLSGLSLVNFLR